MPGKKTLSLYTIGFTQKNAETFFGMLSRSGAKRLVDIRLNNVSQLAGFTKRDDLRYFARALCGIEYEHRLDLAPTQELLDYVRKQQGRWDVYERAFRKLMTERRIEQTVPRALMDGACLLCSEAEPDHCHRRLVAEYLRDHWGAVEIVHLV
jgi:uncharacterized protein (DUF488 family)